MTKETRALAEIIGLGFVEIAAAACAVAYLLAIP